MLSQPVLDVGQQVEDRYERLGEAFDVKAWGLASGVERTT